MKTKQLISGILALSMVCGLTACGSEEHRVLWHYHKASQ